jgi:hypothetical protein
VAGLPAITISGLSKTPKPIKLGELNETAKAFRDLIKKTKELLVSHIDHKEIY